jgi:DNA helicase HerA-like ATPase
MTPNDPIRELLELIRVYNLRGREMTRAKRLAEHGLLTDATARFYLRKAHEAVKHAKRAPNLLPEPASAEELGQFGIELGELQENPNVRIGIRNDGRSRHIMVSGGTGSGKSNTIRAIIMGVHAANQRPA